MKAETKLAVDVPCRPLRVRTDPSGKAIMMEHTLHLVSSVSNARRPFQESRTIHVWERYWIVNATNAPLFYKQEGSDPALELDHCPIRAVAPAGSVAVHSDSKRSSPRI